MAIFQTFGVSLNIKVVAKQFFAIVTVLSINSSPVYAGQNEPSVVKDVLIENAYMPEVPKVSRMGAIYLDLTNIGSETILLKGVTTDIAYHSMIHRTVDSDGVAKMKHMDELSIKPKQMVKFEPNGIHIMLMGLDHDELTSPFEVTLEFNDNKKHKFLVKIKKPD